MITEYVKNAVTRGLALLPAKMDTVNARVMIYAIGLQESRFTYRYQIITKPGQPIRKGPARGFWQFEEGGALPGLMTLDATKQMARDVCEQSAIPFNRKAIWEAFEYDDELACAFARLLLYSDPKPLPSVSSTEASWDYYIRTWRPGKPHRKTWNVFHSHAVDAADRRKIVRMDE